MTMAFKKTATKTTRPLVWTYTLLNTYRSICAHQAWRRYILKKGDPGFIPFVMTPQVELGNRVHEALESRIQGRKPLPVDLHAYESFATPFDGLPEVKCESKLAITREGKPCDYFATDVWGRGRADLVAMQGHAAQLIDWKTGSSRYESPFELEIQALLLQAKYPHLRTIHGQYVWLKENRLSTSYDLSDTRATWQTVQHLVKLIENDLERGIFDKEQGPLCSWCDVLDCEFNKKSQAA
jgi:hypothetical protein